MSPELTHKLLKRFPVLYQDYYSPMSQTCMCWGFECNDGWFDIIWQLSLAIEDELGYSWLQKDWLLTKKRWAKYWNRFIYWASPVRKFTRIQEGTGINGDPIRIRFEPGPEPRFNFLKKLMWFPQTGFAVTQVKEKFGTLRVYSPGNDRIFRYIRWADLLSGETCETCGKPGRVRGGGWLYCSCIDHAEEQDLNEEELARKAQATNTGA